MIFIGGAGGMIEAARAMRRIQRRIDARAELSRERRRARRRRSRGEDYEPPRTDFPCMHLCGACGYLTDDVSDDSPCPSCGDTFWQDLAVEPIADAIRDMEAEERMRAPWGVRALVVGITLGIALLTLAALSGWSMLTTGTPMTTEAMRYGALVVMATMLVMPAVVWLAPRSAAALVLRAFDRPPSRWHVPTSLPTPDDAPIREHEEVRVELAGDTVTAPFSGEECVAYQVSVLFDAPGDARPPEWVLQEQRSASINLAGERLEPGALYLESAVDEIEVDWATEDARCDEIRRFLRKRGLFVTDGEFRFFESRLEAGDVVDAAEHEGPLVVVRSVR